MTAHERPDWHDLAEQASKEMNSEKLMSLVGQLNQALDENEQTSQRRQTGTL